MSEAKPQAAPPLKPQVTPEVAAEMAPNPEQIQVQQGPTQPPELRPTQLPMKAQRQPQKQQPSFTPQGQPAKAFSQLPPLPPLDKNFPGLVAIGLQKSYKKRKVLHDVSIGIRPGEVVGLLGPNGAGKTTSFYIVCGLVPADRGYVGLNQRNISNMAMYRRARAGLGYLPQEASIFRGMTVAQNILSALEVVERDRRKRKARLEQLLGEFSITHLQHENAMALSGGERRRAEIARALASDPQFILLDEPFAGVDPIAVGDIRDLVKQLKDRGLGVLITDHNVRDTLDVVDRAYIIYQGAVLMQGLPEEIVANERVRQVYLGADFTL